MEGFVLDEEVQAGFYSKGNPSHLFGRFEWALNQFNLIVEELIATLRTIYSVRDDGQMWQPVYARPDRTLCAT